MCWMRKQLRGTSTSGSRVELSHYTGSRTCRGDQLPMATDLQDRAHCTPPSLQAGTSDKSGTIAAIGQSLDPVDIGGNFPSARRQKLSHLSFTAGTTNFDARAFPPAAHQGPRAFLKRSREDSGDRVQNTDEIPCPPTNPHNCVEPQGEFQDDVSNKLQVWRT